MNTLKKYTIICIIFVVLISSIISCMKEEIPFYRIEKAFINIEENQSGKLLIIDVCFSNQNSGLSNKISPNNYAIIPYSKEAVNVYNLYLYYFVQPEKRAEQFLKIDDPIFTPVEMVENNYNEYTYYIFKFHLSPEGMTVLPDGKYILYLLPDHDLDSDIIVFTKKNNNIDYEVVSRSNMTLINPNRK